jgi:nitrate/nitrite transport system ATP-binding protein
MDKPLVKIEKVGMTFDTKSGKFTALRDIDLDIAKARFVTDRPLGLRQERHCST